MGAGVFLVYDYVTTPFCFPPPECQGAKGDDGNERIELEGKQTSD